MRNLNKVTNDVYQQYKGKNSKLHLAHYHRHFDIGASWNFSSSTGSQSWVDGILVSIKYQAIPRTLSDERTTAILKPHELNEVSSKGTTLTSFPPESQKTLRTNARDYCLDIRMNERGARDKLKYVVLNCLISFIYFRIGPTDTDLPSTSSSSSR